jgi:hypothetical protein
MFKGKLSVIVLSCLLPSLVCAQDFSFQPGKPKKDTAIAPPIIPKVDVLTPDEFKTQVNTLNQQNQDQLGKLVEKMLPPKLPQAGAQPDAVKVPPADVSTAKDKTLENSAPAVPPPAPAAPAEPNPAATGYAPAFPNEPNNGASPAPAISPSSTSSQPSQQRQGYTGFGGGGAGGGSTTGTGAGSGSQSSGGWNIKY